MRIAGESEQHGQKWQGEVWHSACKRTDARVRALSFPNLLSFDNMAHSPNVLHTIDHSTTQHNTKFVLLINYVYYLLHVVAVAVILVVADLPDGLCIAID
jgi:hypothetical protein